MFLRLFLDPLHRHAGFHRHGASDRVDVLDAMHALERQRDLVGRGHAALHQSGEAAERHDGLPCRMAGREHARHLVGTGGADDRPRATGAAISPAHAAGSDIGSRQQVGGADDGSQGIEQ